MREVSANYSAVANAEQVSKVLRNTYALLAMTLLFSAVTAGISMAVNLSYGVGMICSLVALALIWFVIPRTANSSAGLGVVFAFTGLLGLSLGPILNHYLNMANGGSIVMQALGGTALVFFSLSAYVLTSKKDFSFMGGFLAVGMIVALVAIVGSLIAGFFFGVDVSVFNLAISAVIVLLMSGFILYHTSEIINGGETNYILATVSLYLAIYNLFTSLLHLLGAMGDD